MTGSPRSVWSLGAELGEGPVWVDGRLWFVDIKSRRIHRYDPATDEKRSWSAPEQVGFIVPRAAGGMIVGLQSGLFLFDPAAETFERLVEVEPERPGNRLNDAVVGASGRLFFGTMHDAETDPSGAFHRFAGSTLAPTGFGGIAITNGPALSPNEDEIYLVDTLGGTISAAPINSDGRLGDSRVIVRIPESEGYPDGPTVDSEGAIWIGLYNGWEARRYSPDGELLERVKFPVANVTKIAFGGDDLKTAFATTARQLLSAEAIAKQPQIGDLFAFEVEVPGLPCHPVR